MVERLTSTMSTLTTGKRSKYLNRAQTITIPNQSDIAWVQWICKPNTFPEPITVAIFMNKSAYHHQHITHHLDRLPTRARVQNEDNEFGSTWRQMDPGDKCVNPILSRLASKKASAQARFSIVSNNFRCWWNHMQYSWNGRVLGQTLSPWFASTVDIFWLPAKTCEDLRILILDDS